MSAETRTLETSARRSSFVPLPSHFLDHHNADAIHFFFRGGAGEVVRYCEPWNNSHNHTMRHGGTKESKNNR